MNEFIGRSREMEALEEAYCSDRFGFIPIYGRRRVGKSQLILEFIRDKQAVYFLGKQAPASFQLHAWMETVARALDRPSLAALAPDNWRTALSAVVEQKSPERKLIIVLDEFQWIAAASPELPSILQELIDMEWLRRSDLMIILCGSLIGFMEREVLGSKSPLYGRRTAQILLRPFSYREAAGFHPGWSLEDAAKAYFVCGGIPYYHRLFQANRSLSTNLCNLLFKEEAPLFREADFLLREELREVQRYHGILTAIGTGDHELRAIARRSGIEERQLSYYLNQLMELGYVARRQPFHTFSLNPKPGRNSRYVIADALLSFWFRFVFPNTSYLAQAGAKDTFHQLVAPHLVSHFGHRFEELCREALPGLYRSEGVAVPFQVGEFWNKNVQIDVVGIQKDERIDLGECKWGRVPSAPALVKELEAKEALFPNPENLTVQRRIFSRKPISGREKHKGTYWHSLKDLYAND